MSEQLDLLDVIEQSVEKSEVDSQLQSISEHYRCALNSLNTESVSLVISGFILGYTETDIAIHGFNELSDGFKLGCSYVGRNISGVSFSDEKIEKAKSTAISFMKHQQEWAIRFREASVKSRSFIPSEPWVSKLAAEAA